MKKNLKSKDVCLVQMPIAPVKSPSLSLSLFKALLNEKKISSKVIYGNFKFAEKIDRKKYFLVEYSASFHLLGEFLFSPTVGWKTARAAEEYPKWLEMASYKNLNPLVEQEKLRETLLELQKEANKTIAETVDEVLSFRPKIVACASMFQQNLASLALLRKLKEKEPDIITLIGGPNCMGEAGVAMAETIPWLDYVFSGEADEIFADFCAKLLSNGLNIPEDDLPYGVIKKGMYLGLSNKAPFRISQNLDTLPTPDYSDFFEALEDFSWGKHISPGLLIEGSRGCWWGEKKPCSFCSLGGLSNKYRMKSTAKVLTEIKELSSKHNLNKFSFTDSILGMKHIHELIPKLIELNRTQENKYIFFCEIKSNLTVEQIENLKKAGFSWLQPGIESIQDDFLQMMNKGNKAIKHIEFLKHCRSYCIKLFWNLLVGFPQEKKEWLAQITELIPLITHLPPPALYTRQIMYQKHNIYVQNQKNYGLCLKPEEAYEYLYPNSKEYEGLIESIAYYFEPVDQEEKVKYYEVCSTEQTKNNLVNKTVEWNKNFYHNYDTMTMQVYENRLEIVDLRSISQNNFITLTGAQKEVYICSDNAISKKALFAKLSSQFTLSQIEQALEILCQKKLMININDEVLALATKKTKYYYEDFKEFPMGFLDYN